MLNGDSVIGDTNYSQYLLCGNLHSLKFTDEDGELDTVGYKTIINNGISDTIAF
jgi:hypothetical protein